jgi:hypothetical protein
MKLDPDPHKSEKLDPDIRIKVKPGALEAQNGAAEGCGRLKWGGFVAGFRIRIHFIRIRIQRLRLETNPDPIRIQGFNYQK